MARNILKVKRKPKVVKAYRQSVPATRFIGIKYGDEDRVNGGFGEQWNEWHKQERFKFLEENCPKVDFEDSDACIGLMRWKEEEPFQYWVGKFFAEGADVPEGFDFVDFPASELGVGWLYGKRSYIFAKEDLAFSACDKQGVKCIPDSEDATWFFERYASDTPPRPKKKGKFILDVCFFAEKEGEAKKVRVCKKCSGFDVAELEGILTPEEYSTCCIGKCLRHNPKLEGKVFGLINDAFVVCDSKEEFLAKIQ